MWHFVNDRLLLQTWEKSSGYEIMAGDLDEQAVMLHCRVGDGEVTGICILNT